MLPITFQPERSQEVFQLTKEYFEKHSAIENSIADLFWTYHALGDTIPHTLSNFWSGHNFPYSESWEELQISYNLVCFGFYKQAMCSLRSVLELGLLSVYYNINDEGHKTVQSWLKSEDSKEADTPRNIAVWKIISTNRNISEFQKIINIKQKLLDLGFLHNYVHTKGRKYSNELGMLKSNFQTFEKTALEHWLETVKEIVKIVTTLNILKFPTSIVEFDYSTKFGIHIPSFPHLNIDTQEKLKKLFSKEYFFELKKLAENDPETIAFKESIKLMPNLTDEDIEKQILDWDKRTIQRQGIFKFKEQQLIIYRVEEFDDLPDYVKTRYFKLENWAFENNFTKPIWEK